MKKLTESKMYAAQSTSSETVQACTSGGIAHEIAQWAIRNGFYVLGTIYNHATEQAEMQLAKTDKEIDAFKGSKYLQSCSENAIDYFIVCAKQNQSQGFVVFGTPCQIYGLRQLALQNKLKNPIYFIDLFCHGVPSYLVWDAFRKEQGFSETTEVEFRDHKAPWHFFRIKMSDKEKCLVLDKEKATFYQLFFDNQSLNYACIDCPVRKEDSAADIRLGDFWGKRYTKRFDGVSLCAVMTDNGEKLMREMQDNNKISILQPVSATEGLEAQSTHTYHSQPDLVFDDIQHGTSLTSVISRYRSVASLKMKMRWKLKYMSSLFPMSLQRQLRKWL